MSKGVKHDQGKPRPDLIFSAMARAILEVSKVAAFGAEKYDDDNWLLVADKEKRYRDAKGRHMLLGAIEKVDADSGLSHLAHEAWNAIALLEIHMRAKGGAGLSDQEINAALKHDHKTDIETEYTLEQVVGDATLSDWAEWVAVDESGLVCEFDAEPVRGDHLLKGIFESDGGEYNEINNVAPPKNWEICLFKVENANKTIQA